MKKTLRLNNLKTRTVVNVKILVFFVCFKAIIYLLLYNLHGYTFNCDIEHTLFKRTLQVVLHVAIVHRRNTVRKLYEIFCLTETC